MSKSSCVSSLSLFLLVCESKCKYLKVKVKEAQSCPTLCKPKHYTVHGILQARILEWVTFPFSRGSSQPKSSALQADSLPAELQGKPDKYLCS